MERNHVLNVDPHCPHCQSILPSVGATFCPSCGTILLGDQEKLDQIRILQLYEKAEECFVDEEWSEGIYLLIDALRLDPSNQETRERISEARKQFRVMRLIEWAEEHYFSRNLDGALQNLQEVLKIRPDDEEILDLVAEINEEYHQVDRKRNRKRRRQKAFNSTMVVIFYLLMAAFMVVLGVAMFMLLGVRVPIP
ncbi:MAG: hypothetical protein V2J07_00510 [Anaerolineae bacterium]|nr:hypothetical protein [Anaerolineae bacterium]